MTSVRVGIVSWNTAGLLDRCLATLPAALEGTEYEVVVVDNASRDASADVVAGHPFARLVGNAGNVGYGRAMNQALTGTAAAVLVALNPDTELPPGSLRLLAERLLADPGVALVGPRLVDAGGRPQYSARRFPSLAVAGAACLLPVRRHRGALGRRLLLEAAPPPTTPTDVDWMIGAVHVIRASAIRGRLPYDERWFMYGEDIELCWWLAERGWRCRFEADIVVTHVGHAAGAQAWTTASQYDERCYDAIYDWYRRDIAAGRVRALAAINALTAASRYVAAHATGRPADHAANRRRAAAYHAGIALHGAPKPAGPPNLNGAAEAGRNPVDTQAGGFRDRRRRIGNRGR